MRRLRLPSEPGSPTWAPCFVGPNRHCAGRSQMPHLSDGVLRRMWDEPLAVEARQKQHYDDCQGWQARSHAIADEAGAVAQLMAVPELNLSPGPAVSEVRRGMEAGEAGCPVSPVG